MAKRFEHINQFLKDKNKRPKRQARKKVKEIIKSKPLEKKLPQFDKNIDSYYSFVYRSLFMPKTILQYKQSDTYFLFAIIHYLVFLLFLFLHGSIQSDHINVKEGLFDVSSGICFSLFLIMITYFIQYAAINTKITYLKVFVDTVSYYTIFNLIIIVQIALQIFMKNLSGTMHLLSFLMIATIPMRLFYEYHEDKKSVDIYSLQMVSFVCIVIYLYLTKDIPWLHYFNLDVPSLLNKA